MHTHHARQRANHTHLKTALLHRLAALQAYFFQWASGRLKTTA
ncbi:hypothetical protein EV680_11553 [Uruburuella suis]|uniref:Uncharacterized protein n=1 Tax=Uruburuella suis TaxID=252130 RepID=A0ABY2C3P4_9NEIS|nr:hypothetical protein EV680_11553 [Uruburuella suis]